MEDSLNPPLFEFSDVTVEIDDWLVLANVSISIPSAGVTVVLSD